MKPLRPLLCLLVVLMAATPLPARAAAAPDTFSGAWKILVDATLEENRNWHSAYTAAGAEGRATLRAGWEKRVLVIDLASGVFTQQAQNNKISRLSITNQQYEGGTLRITVSPKVGEPFTVNLTHAGTNHLRFVIDTEPPIILTRTTDGAALP